MSRTTGAAHAVIVLDLRSGAHTLASPGALRAAVQEQLRTEGLPEPGNGTTASSCWTRRAGCWTTTACTR